MEWLRSFSRSYPPVQFAKEKVLVFFIIRKNAKIVKL